MEDQGKLLRKIGPSIKVGLHEWIVTDITRLNTMPLWTNSLTSCVGVAIVTPTHAFVTHLYSELTSENWEAIVKGEFLKAISKIDDLNSARKCVVISGHSETLINAVLESVKQIMAGTGCEVSCVKGKSAVSAYFEKGNPCIEVISQADEPTFKSIMNSTKESGAQHCKYQGVFSGVTSSLIGPTYLGKD